MAVWAAANKKREQIKVSFFISLSEANIDNIDCHIDGVASP